MIEEDVEQYADRQANPAVGYRNPPVEHRFKTGCSGNRRGRPKKSTKPASNDDEQLVEALVIKEAYRMVSIRDGDKIVKMPALQAVMRGLVVAGIKGSHRAQVKLKEVTQDIEERQRARLHDYYDKLAQYKRECEHEFEQCDLLGKPRPDHVPHPADIQIDTIKGEVRIVGPKDELHKAKWDKQLARKKEAVEAIAEYQQMLKKKLKLHEAAFWEREIAFEQHLVRMTDYYLPDEATRRSLTYDPSKRGTPPGRFPVNLPANSECPPRPSGGRSRSK